MQSFIQQIEADAAARLVIPPGRTPRQELARYKHFVKMGHHRLKLRHRAGAAGRPICQGRTLMIDVLLRHILDSLKAYLPTVEKTPLPPLTLVATGGYGRKELNPHSDIDIMFLYDGEVQHFGKHRACMSILTEELLLTLFDLGMKVGHAARTVEECVQDANSDMQIKTSLIDSRLISGDASLFQRMQAVVLAKCVSGHEDEYIAMRLADQSARRGKYGDSACMQEPNVKNGCGGLRDYQNLLWMAYFKYRVRTLIELEEREWISETERFQLEEAYDFLLRTRNDLHYQVNRSVDLLLKTLQPTIAHNLGFTDRSPIRRLEEFMRELYTHMRNVYLITRTVESRLAFQQKPKRRSWRQILLGRFKSVEPPSLDGFLFVEGEIVAASKRVFSDQPRRLMRVFLYAQQRGLRLHPDLVQSIRQQLNLVDRHFLKDTHVHQTFLEILSQRGNVAPVLRTMHEAGLLGRFLPEFGKLTCLVQHEFFHRYTADEHTLICVEMLDAIWTAQKPPFNRYKDLFQKIERPNLLYLALLLHDAGKAAGGRKHADKSAILSVRVSRRLGLDEKSLQDLKLLIEHHLALVNISQRRDLEDPVVSRRFAQQIQNLDNLNKLLLLTFADTMGTRADLWNDFKEVLILTLFDQTARVLQGASAAKMDVKERASLASQVRRQLPKTIDDDEIRAHFDHLPPRYFQVNTVEEMLTDIQLAHQFMQLQMQLEEHALEPVIAWQNVPDRGYAIVRVCTWDRAGLFSKITGSLTAADMSILAAQIFSRADGVIFDAFTVVEARAGTVPGKESRAKMEQTIKAALVGQADLDHLLARLKKSRPLYQYLEGETIPTLINVDNSSSDNRTLIEIETEDRVGLLYAISHALSDLKLDISTAKITTEKGAAIDSFYVRDEFGNKILDPEQLGLIEQKLRAALAKLDKS